MGFVYGFAYTPAMVTHGNAARPWMHYSRSICGAGRDSHSRIYHLPSTTISRQRPSRSGTEMPSMRWSHHSTMLQGGHGCQPQNLRCPVGIDSTWISRLQRNQGRVKRRSEFVIRFLERSASW